MQCSWPDVTNWFAALNIMSCSFPHTHLFSSMTRAGTQNGPRPRFFVTMLRLRKAEDGGIRELLLGNACKSSQVPKTLKFLDVTRYRYTEDCKHIAQTRRQPLFAYDVPYIFNLSDEKMALVKLQLMPHTMDSRKDNTEAAKVLQIIRAGDKDGIEIYCNMWQPSEKVLNLPLELSYWWWHTKKKMCMLKLHTFRGLRELFDGRHPRNPAWWAYHFLTTWHIDIQLLESETFPPQPYMLGATYYECVDPAMLRSRPARLSLSTTKIQGKGADAPRSTVQRTCTARACTVVIRCSFISSTSSLQGGATKQTESKTNNLHVLSNTFSMCSDSASVF